MASRNQEGEYLSFLLSGIHYAIPVLNVKSIVQPTKITRVPHSISSIVGVLNYHGKIIPVFDLDSCMANDKKSVKLDDFLLIILGYEIDDKELLLALKVESICDFHNLTQDSFNTHLEKEILSEYILGVVSYDAGALQLLNLPLFFEQGISTIEV